MSVKVTSNSTQVKIDIKKRCSIAARLFIDDIDKNARPNTPKKFGVLRNSVQKQVLGTRGTIIWPQEYAAIQERGVIKGRKIRNYTTSGTGPHFARNAIKSTTRNAGSIFKRAGLS